MAERRGARTKRRPGDDELAQLADDVLAEEPDDETAEELDDEAAEEPEDEAAEEPEDEAAEEPEDELAEEPDDEPAEEEDADEEDADEDSGQSGNDGGGTGRRPRRGRGGGLTAAKAGQAALRQIAELTGEPAEDGWAVGVEILEDRRIPSSTDILAIYEVEIDSGGDLMSYRRVKRYPRGRGDDEDS